MRSKGKQVSVIIAGATGNTGCNLVSRLVSHPDVSRVVALTRYPIPVNRWTSVFPHLHPGDALRCLSVVPVDWTRVLADASNIPLSYVSDGVWRQEEEQVERLRFLNYMAHSSGVSTINSGGNSGSSRIGLFSGSGLLTSGGSHKNSTRERGSTSGLWSSVSTVESAVGIRPLGYVTFKQRGRSSGEQKGSLHTSIEDKATSKEETPHFTDAEKLRDSQAFLQQLLHSDFYNSVFSGHTAAINCLGTPHVLSTSSVLLVDYELSIAFAKMIRLFNCMAHTDSSDDEERLLVEITSRELDSVLWGEIYSACYGKKPEVSTTSLENPPSADHKKRSVSPPPDASGPGDGASSSVPWGAEEAQHMSHDSTGTLKHYSQISVRGANAHSSIPYLRAHGLRDCDLLNIFGRRARTLPSQGALRSTPLSTPTAPHLVTLKSTKDTSATDDPQGSRFDNGLSGGPDSPRLEASPIKEGTGAAAVHRHHSQSGGGLFLSPLRQLWRGLKGDAAGGVETRCRFPDGADVSSPEESVDPDAVARRRAQLLLRRDVVKIWENASFTVWRPGVFARPRPRLVERLFSLFERPVDVGVFTECVVDDVMESIHKEGDLSTLGSVKVINGKDVNRHMGTKAIEGILGRKDTRVLRRT